MMWVRLFHRYIVRDMLQRPIRTLLTLAGVALGIGVVWGVHLSNERSIGWFSDSVNLISGQADFQVKGNGVPIDEDILERLSWFWEYGRISPVIEARVRLPDSRSVPAYGIDLLSDAPFRDYVTEDGKQLFSQLTEAGFLQLLTRPNQLIVPRRLAQELALDQGDVLPLVLGDRETRFTVGAILQQRGAADAFGGHLVFMDIANAQTVLSRVGQVDRLDLLLDREQDAQKVLARLSQDLPPGISVWRPQDLSAQSRRMLRAFRFNLAALSYLSLIVGVILVYNTLNLAVVRRQSEIASLRTLGAGRWLVSSFFLAEAILFGFAGALLGLGLGWGLAEGAELLVGRTVEALYTGIDLGPASHPDDWSLALVAVLLGALLGAVSGLQPALRAVSRPPAEVLREGFLVGTRPRIFRLQTLLGCCGLPLAVLLSLLPPWGGLPLAGYLAAIVLMASCALLVPRLADFFLAGLDRLRPKFPVEVRLALQSVRGGLSRLVVAVISLMIAVAMLVGVASMVGSFRETVRAWLEQTLVADLYVRAAGAGSNDWSNPVRAETVARLESAPEVAAVGRFRGRSIEFNGIPVTLAGGDFAVLGRFGRLLFVDGRSTVEVAERMLSGKRVVISEPLALRFGLRQGDPIQLPTPRGPDTFEIEAVYYDYSSDRGVVVMDWSMYRQMFADEDATSLSVYLKPGLDADDVRLSLLRRLGDARVQMYPNQDLKRRAIEVFDQTFQVTYALEIIAIVVAVLGVTNTLGALILERQGEIALLRFLGADARQLRWMAFLESGLVGLLGLIWGTILGGGLSLLLIFVINRQSFGWTLQVDPPWLLLASALSGVFLSTLVAGFYPAVVAATTDPIRSLRTE